MRTKIFASVMTLALAGSAYGQQVVSYYAEGSDDFDIVQAIPT